MSCPRNLHIMANRHVIAHCSNLPLPTPRTRKNYTLQAHPRQLAVVPATGRTRPGVSITRLCEQRVRRVFALRDSGTRIFASEVHQLPARDARGIQLQKKRILSQLRCPTDGRDSGTLSRSRAATQKHSSMGSDIPGADPAMLGRPTKSHGKGSRDFTSGDQPVLP